MVGAGGLQPEGGTAVGIAEAAAAPRGLEMPERLVGLRVLPRGTSCQGITGPSERQNTGAFFSGDKALRCRKDAETGRDPLVQKVR